MFYKNKVIDNACTLKLQNFPFNRTTVTPVMGFRLFFQLFFEGLMLQVTASKMATASSYCVQNANLNNAQNFWSNIHLTYSPGGTLLTLLTRKDGCNSLSVFQILTDSENFRNIFKWVLLLRVTWYHM